MSIPSLADLSRIYVPPPGGALELNISDEWRARFTEADELPPNAPLAYGYAILYMGDKGYVVRRADDEGARWGVVEGPFQEGEKPQAWVKRLLKEQAGATAARIDLVGYLDCKATSHNPDFPPGAITVRPIYLVVAKQVKDVPETSGYARRRLPLNEHATAVRNRYPELQAYFSKAFDRYLVLRARGEV